MSVLYHQVWKATSAFKNREIPWQPIYSNRTGTISGYAHNFLHGKSNFGELWLVNLQRLSTASRPDITDIWGNRGLERDSSYETEVDSTNTPPEQTVICVLLVIEQTLANWRLKSSLAWRAFSPLHWIKWCTILRTKQPNTEKKERSSGSYCDSCSYVRMLAVSSPATIVHQLALWAATIDIWHLEEFRCAAF